MIDEILKNINDPLTNVEYSRRTEDFKNNLNRFIDLMVSYNINPRFIEYEVKRCIGISGFPGHSRFIRDLKNPVLDSGTDDKTQNELSVVYTDFFGETVYAEDIQLLLGQEKPRIQPPDHKIKRDLNEKASATVVVDMPSTSDITTYIPIPSDTTTVTKYIPTTFEPAKNPIIEKQRIIQFESGNRLTLNNIESFDNTKNYLRFKCAEGLVLVDPKKVEYHIIKEV